MHWEGQHLLHYLQLFTALSIAGLVSRESPYETVPFAEYGLGSFRGESTAEHLVGFSDVGRESSSGFQSSDIASDLKSFYTNAQASPGDGALRELSGLVSLEEAYRRGDISPVQGQVVLPVTERYQSSVPLTARSSEETEYGSSSSPLSTLSSSSPISFNEYFQDFRDVSDLSTDAPGAAGITPSLSDLDFPDFDINDILEHDSDVSDDRISLFDDLNFKGADSKALGSVVADACDGGLLKALADLDYEFDDVSIPSTKSISSDQFLYGNELSTAIGWLDDPAEDIFQMKFDGSTSDNKYLSRLNSLESLDSVLSQFDQDKTALDSLSDEYGEDLHNVNALSEYPGKEVHALNDLHPHFAEHDYPKIFKENELKSMSELGKAEEQPSLGSDSVKRRVASRTYAPAKKSMTEKQQPLWPGFSYTKDDIVEMPVEKFNEIVGTLPELQQHVARDMRRKGKNKVAARLCRKRKLHAIEHLDAGIETLSQQRQRLLNEKAQLLEETKAIQTASDWLQRYIIEHLRSDDGKTYAAEDFSLQYFNNGGVFLVPNKSGKPEISKRKLAT